MTVYFDSVRWGIQGCQTPGCNLDAEVIWDDRELLCIPCADRNLERLQIIGEHGYDVLRNLPAVGEWFEVVHPYKEWKRDGTDSGA